MFLDASAIIAILADEEDAAALLAKIAETRQSLFYSHVSLFESVVGLARKKSGAHREGPIDPQLVEQAERHVFRFLNEIGAREMAIAGEVGSAAIAASRVFGRIVGHPARLNMGDCFAYACARHGKMPLLYKGDDFRETDIPSA
jgi:ribonuclease VapC